MHPEHNFLACTALAMLPVIINPEPGGKRDGKGSKANTAGQRKQVLEDGDCFGENERDDCETKSAR